MAYTANKLAKLSGVSVRTLHFYDEIELLKPAYYGENNYRYYEEEQLLMLQQILFYKELGFALKDIQKILCSKDFDKVKALESHKKILSQSLNQTKNLIKTIDKTIAHLRGKATMKSEELYYGFDSEKQKQYEKELVEKGIVTQESMDDYMEKKKDYTQKDHEKFIKEGELINQEFIIAINKNLKPSSKEVQEIVRRHHAWVGWNPTKEKYIGLSQLYQTPEFRKFYEKLNPNYPNFLEFMVEAMVIFAERELK